jgi:hypothetical protein
MVALRSLAMLINRNEPTAAAPRLRVKLLGKSKPGEDGAGWLSRFRGNQPVWGTANLFSTDIAGITIGWWFITICLRCGASGIRYPPA